MLPGQPTSPYGGVGAFASRRAPGGGTNARRMAAASASARCRGVAAFPGGLADRDAAPAPVVIVACVAPPGRLPIPPARRWPACLAYSPGGGGGGGRGG